MKPINIKVKFAGEIFRLADANSRAKSDKSGVEIYIKTRPGGDFQPMAVIPDGTLEKYKHERPQVISVEWKEG